MPRPKPEVDESECRGCHEELTEDEVANLAGTDLPRYCAACCAEMAREDEIDRKTEDYEERRAGL